MKLKYMMCVAAVSMLVGQVAVGGSPLGLVPVGATATSADWTDSAAKKTPTDQPPAESPNNAQLKSPPPSPEPIVEGPPPSPKATK